MLSHTPPPYPDTPCTEFDDICEAADSANKVSQLQAWKNIFFKREYRPSLVLATMIPLFQQWTGINVSYCVGGGVGRGVVGGAAIISHKESKLLTICFSFVCRPSCFMCPSSSPAWAPAARPRS